MRIASWGDVMLKITPIEPTVIEEIFRTTHCGVDMKKWPSIHRSIKFL